MSSLPLTPLRLGQFTTLVVTSVLMIILSAPTNAQIVSVRTNNTWSGMFASSPFLYMITLDGEPHSSDVIFWSLQAKGRQLAGGQQAVRFARSGSFDTGISLQTPPLKPGVMLSARLIIKTNDQKLLHDAKLNIFGPDLIAKEVQSKHMDIRLFDPRGDTKKLLDQLQIRHHLLSKPQLYALDTPGFILVGAGIDLDNHRGLSETLLEYSRRGFRILILQPISGEFHLAGASAQTELAPSAIAIAGKEIIQSFAKDHQWLSQDPLNKYGLSLVTHRQTIRVAAGPVKTAHWSWLHLSFKHSGGHLTICTLPLIHYASDNPVPQIIFNRLLAHAYTATELTAQHRKDDK